MKAYVYLLMSFIITLYACSNGNKDAKVSTAANQHIIPPDTIELYNPFYSDKLINPLEDTTGYRIITMIDVSCASCLMKVKKWNDFKNALDGKYSASVIPICVTKDNFEMLKYMIESDSTQKLNLTMLLDTQKKFIKQNTGLIGANGDITVLADNHNKVLLKGNPLENPDDKDLFLKKIAELR